MLSITHPAVMEYVHELPIGMLPIIFKGDSVPRLIIKANKEIILAAKVRKGFSIHLVPYNVNGVKSFGFLVAFYDDKAHPLIIIGALFEELLGYETCMALISKEVNVHFFDELGREILGYKAILKASEAHKALLTNPQIPSAEGLNQSAILNYISDWFRTSSVKDDVEALKVELVDPLFPESFFYADMRDESHMYHGSSNVSHYTLERNDPGTFQEKEIISLLERSFESTSIYHSPKRVYDREEVCDILVVTERNVFIVQAKDSPNLEKTVNLPINRKKSTAIKALRKGAGQVMGASKYLKRKEPAVFLMGDNEVEFSLQDRSLYGLVIMKELFDEDYDEYTPILLNVHGQTGVPTIALSYSELHHYTRFLTDDQSFLEAFMKVFNWGIEHGMFPRLRVMHPKTFGSETN